MSWTIRKLTKDGTYIFKHNKPDKNATDDLHKWNTNNINSVSLFDTEIDAKNRLSKFKYPSGWEIIEI